MHSYKQTNIVELLEIERSLKNSLVQFQSYYVRATQIDASTRQNNQKIIQVLIKSISHSLKPLEYLLKFLDDHDIMNVGTTCRALYRVIYSPLGFRICRYLRPIVLVKTQQLEDQIPFFSQTTVDQLCSDRSLENADQDDKMAILLTMKTNIMATKQKVRQLDLIIEAYDHKYQSLLQKIIYIGGEREEQQRKITSLHDQIQKLRQLLKVSQGHAESLKEEQQKMQMERQTKMLVLNDQKAKLLRQKDLLIKKIMSQQKQKQEGMIYAKQVSRVLNRLNQITLSAIGNKK